MTSTIGQIAIVLAALATGQVDGQPTIGSAPDRPPPASKPNEDPKGETGIQLGWSWVFTPSDVAALAAVFVAVTALVYTIRESKATRKHRRLSVKPLVANRWVLSTSSPHISVFFDNKGLGPAVVKRFLVAWGTHVIPHDDDDALHTEIMATIEAFRIRVKYGISHIRFNWLGEGAALCEGESTEILTFENDEDEVKLSNSDARELLGLFSNLRIRLEYQSMYGGEVRVAAANDFERPGQWDEIRDKQE